MSDRDSAPAVARQARAFHAETPHEFQSSLTMSIRTRDLLADIRDDLNDRIGDRVLTTNDVIRLALTGAARYHEVEDDDPAEIRALTASIHEAMIEE